MFIATVSGNLAADPRINEVSGKEVANFTVLVNTVHKGEKITSNIDCSVWGTRAAVIRDYYKKGGQVTVSGTGRVETFTRNNGEPGAKLILLVNEFTLPARAAGASSDDDGL